MSVVREVNVAGRVLKFEFEKFAKQSNGSVMVSSGGTQVLVTVCSEREASPAVDFFPLAVEYIEKAYAAGRLPGGYNKRRPTKRSCYPNSKNHRPPFKTLFPKDFKNETIVTSTVLSYEHGHSPVPLALAGASTALMISEIPFDGPVAALRLGMKDGEYIVDPVEGTEETLDLDLNIACKEDAVLMVEAGAQFLSEEQMIDAIEYAHKTMQPLFEMQREIQKKLVRLNGLSKKKLFLTVSFSQSKINSWIQSKKRLLSVKRFLVQMLLESYKKKL